MARAERSPNSHSVVPSREGVGLLCDLDADPNEGSTLWDHPHHDADPGTLLLRPAGLVQDQFTVGDDKGDSEGG